MNNLPIPMIQISPPVPIQGGYVSPAETYINGLASDQSRRVMKSALDSIAGYVGLNLVSMPWHLLTANDTEAIRARLARDYAPKTANLRLAALKGTLRAAWRACLIDIETFHRITDWKPVKGSNPPKGRALERGEMTALFTDCFNDPTASGRRDAALLAVLIGAGLRREETAALNLSDLDMETGRLTIRRGKGRKARQVYLTNGSRDAMAEWLTARGAERGPLFVPINKGGIITRRRLTAQAVYNMAQKRAQNAKIKHLSPHDFRRTFISELLDAGGDPFHVQGLAGHSSITTTQGYDRRPEKARAKTAELLHVPFIPFEKTHFHKQSKGEKS